MALQAQDQLGYFDSSAWGEDPWEGDVYSMEEEKTLSLMS